MTQCLKKNNGRYWFCIHLIVTCCFSPDFPSFGGGGGVCFFLCLWVLPLWFSCVSMWLFSILYFFFSVPLASVNLYLFFFQIWEVLRHYFIYLFIFFCTLFLSPFLDFTHRNVRLLTLHSLTGMLDFWHWHWSYLFLIYFFHSSDQVTFVNPNSNSLIDPSFTFILLLSISSDLFYFQLLCFSDIKLCLAWFYIFYFPAENFYFFWIFKSLVYFLEVRIILTTQDITYYIV